MSTSQLATYNSCTSRSGYTYSTPLQQPVQSVSLINNSYNGLPNSISGSCAQDPRSKFCQSLTETMFIPDYYLPSVPQSTTSPSLPCPSGAPRRYDTTSHPIGNQFYNWESCKFAGECSQSLKLWRYVLKFQRKLWRKNFNFFSIFKFAVSSLQSSVVKEESGLPSCVSSAPHQNVTSSTQHYQKYVP